MATIEEAVKAIGSYTAVVLRDEPLAHEHIVSLIVRARKLFQVWLFDNRK